MKAILHKLERRTLGTKLLLGFSSLLVLSVLIGAFGVQTQFALNAQLQLTYEADLLGVSNAKDMHIKYLTIGRALRQALIAPDAARREQALAQAAEAEVQMRHEREELLPRIFRPEVKAALARFDEDFAHYKRNADKVVALVREGKFAEATARVSSDEFQNVGIAAADSISTVIRLKEDGARQGVEAAQQLAASNLRTTVILLLGGLGLGVLLAWLTVQSVRRPAERVRLAVETLARGELDIEVPHADHTNEIGDLARAVQVLQRGASQVEEQSWLKSNLALLSNALQSATSYAELCHILFSTIAPVTRIGHGVLYVHEEELHRMRLLGAYGYRQRKNLDTYFAIGQGLVGQCAMERSPIHLTQPPADYVRIGSSLGEAVPRMIAVLPILRNERLLGVLELATFADFGHREEALLDALVPILAMNIEILERSVRAKKLLVETQQQAATLEEQAEELEAQQLALKDTEAWYRSIIESAPDGMLVCNDRGTITLANPTLETMFGYAVGELPGHAIEVLVPEAVRGAHVGLREGYAGAGGVRAMGGAASELLGVRKDGTTFSVEVGLSTLPTVGGRSANVCASVRDITEREAAAQALAEQRQLMQGILDHSPVNIAFSVQGRIQFANPKFQQTFGVGTGDLAVQLYADADEQAALQAAVRRDGIVENRELRMRVRDGQWRDMLLTCLPLRYEEQDGVLAWITDVTARKQAEAELAERMAELERFNRLTVDREERMIELKGEINGLLAQDGQAPKYRIVS